MKSFMDQDFLLNTQTARHLYHDIAEKLPVLDYHCHISPQEIAQDRHFSNITQVWLGGDHYKWRQMRANGVPEYYITGEAPDREKFQKWAQTLEKAIGNPLYHWSHLELRRYFGYEGVLNSETAQEVWELCNEKLASPDMSARNLITGSGVTLLCTTDDPIDDLRWHKQIAEDDGFSVQVLPAWRPDRAVNMEKPDFLAYMEQLGLAAGVRISDYAGLKEALVRRLEYFDGAGCRVSDHGLDYVMYDPAPEEKVEEIFSRRLAGETVSAAEVLKYKTALVLFLAQEYHRLNWVMQLHYGCKRNNSARMFREAGPDTGFDCIGSSAPADQLADFLNDLDERSVLPKTVLYSLNPGDNEAIDTIIGCFQNDDAVGKIQHGSAWWFNDNKTGMEKQLISLANLSLLGNFIGMLTDSRSFISYPRHEYFRRILCELVGGWVENGEYPNDERTLTDIIKGISYNNAVRYFGFDLEMR